MALHTTLYIYKDAYQLFDVVVEVTRNIPRDFRRLIGEKLREECLDILVLIFRANVCQDKTPHLQKLIERLQIIELVLRLGRDKKLIANKHYARAIELTERRKTNEWLEKTLRRARYPQFKNTTQRKPKTMNVEVLVLARKNKRQLSIEPLRQYKTFSAKPRKWQCNRYNMKPRQKNYQHHHRRASKHGDNDRLSLLEIVRALAIQQARKDHAAIIKNDTSGHLR